MRFWSCHSRPDRTPSPSESDRPVGRRGQPGESFRAHSSRPRALGNCLEPHQCHGAHLHAQPARAAACPARRSALALSSTFLLMPPQVQTRSATDGLHSLLAGVTESVAHFAAEEGKCDPLGPFRLSNQVGGFGWYDEPRGVGDAPLPHSAPSRPITLAIPGASHQPLPRLAAKENYRTYACFHGVGIKGSSLEEYMPLVWATFYNTAERGAVLVELGAHAKDVEALQDMFMHFEHAQNIATAIDPISRPFCEVLCALVASAAAVSAALRRFLDNHGEDSELGKAVWRLLYHAYARTTSLGEMVLDAVEVKIMYAGRYFLDEVAQAAIVVAPPKNWIGTPFQPPIPAYPQYLDTASMETMRGLPVLHRLSGDFEPTAIAVGGIVKGYASVEVPYPALALGPQLAQPAVIALYNLAALLADRLIYPMPTFPGLIPGVGPFFLLEINANPTARLPDMPFFAAVAAVRCPLAPLRSPGTPTHPPLAHTRDVRRRAGTPQPRQLPLLARPPHRGHCDDGRRARRRALPGARLSPHRQLVRATPRHGAGHAHHPGGEVAVAVAAVRRSLRRRDAGRHCQAAAGERAAREPL